MEPQWFPAVENRGEGVFVELRAEDVAAWLERPAVTARVAKLAKGYDLWRQTRNTQRPFPGGAYVLLHTLALRCGYFPYRVPVLDMPDAAFFELPE